MVQLFSATNLGRANTIQLEDSVKLAFIDFVSFTSEFGAGGGAPIALIQGANVEQRTNHQFTLSLRQTIYLYVFGNQMGEATISGFIFSGICNDEFGGLFNTGKNGFDAILNFYNSNRLSTKTEPVSIRVGSTAFDGFLIGLQLLPTDVNTLLTPFTMTIKLLPGDAPETPAASDNGVAGALTASGAVGAAGGGSGAASGNGGNANEGGINGRLDAGNQTGGSTLTNKTFRGG